jgi:hypothetical protein
MAAWINAEVLLLQEEVPYCWLRGPGLQVMYIINKWRFACSSATGATARRNGPRVAVLQVFFPVLRILDILVWIRMRIRLLLFSSLTIKNQFKKRFFCLLLFEGTGTFTSFSNIKSQKEVTKQ